MGETIYSNQLRGKFDLFMNDEIEEIDADELLERAVQEKKQEKEKTKKDKTKKEVPVKKPDTKLTEKNISSKESAKQDKIRGPKKTLEDGFKAPRFEKKQQNQDGEGGENEAPRMAREGSRGGSRGGFRGGRGSGVTRPTSDYVDQNQVPDSFGEAGLSGGERSERGRGGRGFRTGGMGTNRGVHRGGRRDFDRHSGSDKTGVKPMEKREGGGAHNWGTVKDDIESAELGQQGEISSAEPSSKTEWAADEENPAPEKIEEVDTTMTLDEWRAKRNQDKNTIKVANAVSTRKANEGKDPFSNMVAYRKDKDASEESDDEFIVDDDASKQKMLNINIRFYDNPRRGGGRRGGTRGGFEGRPENGPRGEGGPRGGGRGGGPAANIRLDSENDFPALK